MNVLLLASALITPMAPPACNWDNPGFNPYKPQNPVVALKDYTMDESTRQALTKKMSAQKYDDVVAIDRDSVVSLNHHQYSDLRDMHFGKNMLCYGPVLRDQWKPKDLQLALVYCEGETCVVVPTICNNVSLITRKPPDEKKEPKTDPFSNDMPTHLADDALESPIKKKPSDLNPVCSVSDTPQSDTIKPTNSSEEDCLTYHDLPCNEPLKNCGRGLVSIPGPLITAAIPEPSTFWLIAVGLWPLLAFKRLKTRSNKAK